MKVKMHNLNLKKTLIKDASENTNTPNPLAILIYFIISLSTKDKNLVSYIISNDLQSLAHLGNVYIKKLREMYQFKSKYLHRKRH